MYVKDLETNKVTKETIDLKSALDKRSRKHNKRIKVDTTKTETTTKTIDGVKTEVTTGKIVITDESSPKYSYMIQVLPKEGTNEYKELMELAKQINAIANNEVEKELSFMEKLELMNKFYTLYTSLEPTATDSAWLPVENMEIMQPNFDKAEDEKEYDNQQYIVFIKNEDGSIIDAQFMTCEAKYNPLYEKETITIKETSKLPVTFDSLTTIIIIFAVIIVAIIIVLVIRKKQIKRKKINNEKVCDIILILLIIGAIIFGVIIGAEYIRREKNEDKLSAVVAQIENINTETNNEENKQELIKVDGYDVEGIIEIPKIDIKYPIVSTTSDEAMKVAITKFWGNNINDIGNYTMAGHNYKNGTMFGKQST